MMSDYSNYWELVASRSDAELRRLAFLKRLADLLAADPQFRAAAIADSEEAARLANSYGCDLSATEIEEHSTALLAAGTSAESTSDDVAQYIDFVRAKVRLRDKTLACALQPTFGSFDAWRERQRSRLSSEIGEAARIIPHSLIAFELARGCSVGCSFCGIDAARFGGAAAYEQYRDEWTGMLRGLGERFGPALRSGFLYWGSDPLDNPDYLSFAGDFRRIAGLHPQITTAIPLRNEQHTRAVLEATRGETLVPHRFSILSLNVFRRVLRTFSPEELLHVELVLQHKEAEGLKANAGRNSYGKPNPVLVTAGGRDNIIAPTTIACVTGFLVNICERRVRMISPTAASAKWPNGYIVFEDRQYGDPVEFMQIIDAMIERQSNESVRRDSRPRFREDLAFRRAADGFELSSPAVTHSFRDYGSLAAAVSAGERTVSEIIVDAPARGCSPGEELAFLTGVFNAGLIELAA